MVKKIFIFLLLFFHCNIIDDIEGNKIIGQQDEKILTYLTMVYQFHDDCVTEYGRLSPLPAFYNPYLEGSVNATIVIIGDSTMDYSRLYSFFNSNTTDNFAVQGNTACDFLTKAKSIASNKYKTAIVASMDGNGLSFGASTELSTKTLMKVINALRNKGITNFVLVGIHPVKTNVNSKKNIINDRMLQYAIDNNHCFIDMVSLFGVGVNDPPPNSYMNDDIHYNGTVYNLLKNKIKTQCGVEI